MTFEKIDKILIMSKKKCAKINLKLPQPRAT